MLKLNKVTIIVMILIAILLSIIDIFANGLNTIPIIGAFLETLSEGIFETLQIIIFSILGINAIMGEKQ